jgi:hypothetical protein
VREAADLAAEVRPGRRARPQPGFFTYRRVRNLVERIENPNALVLKVVFILRGSREPTCGLMPTADHPDRFFAISARSLRRGAPFGVVGFKVEDGKLAVDPGE